MRELSRVMEVFCISLYIGGGTQVQAFVKAHENIHLKAVNFNICKLYLSDVLKLYFLSSIETQ